MGLDLRLLPFDSDFFSHTILTCERRSELFDALRGVEARNGRDVPDNFKTFIARRPDGDTGYGITIRTPYGENLKYVLASDLVTFAEHNDVTDNAVNRAIWAYLQQLNPNTKIALYWY